MSVHKYSTIIILAIIVVITIVGATIGVNKELHRNRTLVCIIVGTGDNSTSYYVDSYREVEDCVEFHVHDDGSYPGSDRKVCGPYMIKKPGQ